MGAPTGNAELYSAGGEPASLPKKHEAVSSALHSAGGELASLPAAEISSLRSTQVLMLYLSSATFMQLGLSSVSHAN